MSNYRRLAPGWRVEERHPDEHYLQLREPSGDWRDVAGPYRTRGAAFQRYDRIRAREVIVLRKADPTNLQLPEHQWQDRLQRLGYASPGDGHDDLVDDERTQTEQEHHADTE